MISYSLSRRETGEGSRTSLANKVAYSRRLGLDCSQSRALRSAHTGGVTWLDLDLVEHRYLLAGAADASVAIYDTQLTAASSGGREGSGTGDEGEAGGPAAAGGAGAAGAPGTAAAAGAAEIEPVATLTKQSLGGHRFSVSSVGWYPVDTGLFVTGGYDNEVKVWDANTLSVAESFSMSGRVNAVAMSPCATSHCLVAVGSAEPQVMLCDIATGGFTHTLSGHRAAVWAIHWSLQSEWHLMTGGCDGQLRLWDIRRAGPLHVFDQHQTQRAQRAERAEQPQSTVAAGSGANKRRRSSSGGAAGGSNAKSSGAGRQRSAGAGAAGQSGQSNCLASERMFLPDKVTRYAAAHGGSITGVAPTPHGLFWLSAGTDDHVRLWDAYTYRHMLVHYPGAFNRSLRARQLAVSEDSRLLFHPSGSAVQMYDVDSGAVLRVLQGAHFDTINCCKWNPVAEELYTGSSDCHIVVWAPPGEAAREEAGESGAGGEVSDEDNWSD